MREVLPGVFHWTAMHPRIHIEVSSYWLDEGGVLIDPLVPPDVGLEWFADRATPPAAVLLSIRHHHRDSGHFVEAFGCGVYCSRAGLHEFVAGEAVEGFDPGDQLAGGVVACEVGALCPDETALYVPAKRAIVFADGVVRSEAREQPGRLGFVPDSLMDDPPETKRAACGVCATARRARVRAPAARPRRAGHRRGPYATRGVRRERRSYRVRAWRLSSATSGAEGGALASVNVDPSGVLVIDG